MVHRRPCLNLSAVLLPYLAAALPFPAASQEAPKPPYELLVPQVVDRGGFTGVILETTEAGQAPLAPGTRLLVGETEVETGAGGRLSFPSLEEELGNVFMPVTYTPPGGGAEGPETVTFSPHVEVVPASQKLPTRLDHASDVLIPGDPLRVEGQGLDALTGARLTGPEGVDIDLGEGFGSALQHLWIVPRDLAPGDYRLSVRDAQGNHYTAPGKSRLPRLQIAGTPVTRRGTRGEITLRGDADLLVRLAGGEPYITLERLTALVQQGEATVVPFDAHRVGDYQVSYSAWSLEEPPVEPWVPRADVEVEPLEVEPGPESGGTVVTAGCRVVDEGGQPLADTAVDVALAHPEGVTYQRLTTDGEGRAHFRQVLPGEVEADQLSFHVFRVLGQLWKEPPDTTVSADACKVESRWLRKTPIRMVRALSHYPAGAALEEMVPGTRIALSVLARDVDVLRQRCTDCGGAAVRRIGPVEDRVRYRWSLAGEGQLSATEGSTVFYLLPKKASRDRDATTTVTLTVDNPPGKAADDPLTTTLTFTIRECDEGECLKVRVDRREAEPPEYDNDVTETAGERCQATEPEWRTAGPIAGEVSVPERLCPGALVILSASYQDPDALRLGCRARDCADDVRDLEPPDPLRYTWTDGGAGGTFPLGNTGPQVLYRAPAEPGAIPFKLTVSDSGTQADDGDAEAGAARNNRHLFDLTAIHLGSRDTNVTVGESHRFTPRWTGEGKGVKRIEWKLDLGGETGAVDKAICDPDGLRPDQAALRFTDEEKEEGLEVSWRLHSHIHGEKVLGVTAFAEACGPGCLCRDDHWEESDFLTGDDHDRFKLFFDKFKDEDDGRVEDLETVRDEDEWGEETELHGREVHNWFLHWSNTTYGTCPYDHASEEPRVLHRSGSPGWLGRYTPEERTIELADGAARDSDRRAFQGRRWIVTSDGEWFDTRTVHQRAYDLKGHTLVNKVFLHEMGHYRSITENWEAAGAWRRAFGPRSEADASEEVVRLPASNLIRIRLTRAGDYNGARAHGRDAVQKVDITVELMANAQNRNQVTHTFNLRDAWVVEGNVRPGPGRGQLQIRGRFEVANGDERWSFRGLRFERFRRANDPDGDFVPNQVEDQIGTRWDHIRTHAHHARGSLTSSGGQRQLPDQEFFADHGVLGTAPPGTGLSAEEWADQVDPGKPERDWANPGAQSDPPC